MFEIENEFWSKGYNYIACIDEVGRGSLAGDVLACAIIMSKDAFIQGVKDSKKLSPKKREKLYDEILEFTYAVGIGRVDPNTIDQINIKESTRLAMKKAVLNLKDKNGNTVIPDYILIDAEEVYLDIPQTSIIKGDEKCFGISCVSIIAKVYRDRLCNIWGKEYEGYFIEKNKGYGTKEHREAIKKLGPSPIHRLTFLKNII
ncbi:ribonuclease HII [Sporanaerobacter acetigenes]|uniref:Ribonuclease HII n=1 Tax=Sporanaerobacter acetigenes DSM 13106 TaxID=1123281 RepID=A0A1M5XZF7_9FIRM|nr:ribonuclease HII [Sporanaerobacter acetigenes]SHI04928.1 RNase HII [Sporanaerobacter acetigenes DSM 13106]